MHFQSSALKTADEYLPFTVGSGGPLVAVPAEAAAAWGNDAARGVYGAHLDYDRACAPNDPIPTEYRGLGWVEVDGLVALVLELDCYTQYLRLGPEQGVLYRAGAEEVTEWEVHAVLARVEPTEWRHLPHPFRLPTGRFFAFDASFAGAETLEAFPRGSFAIEGELAPGDYEVYVATVDGIDLIQLVGQRSARTQAPD